MSSDKTPWAICAATLVTFAVAFGTLTVLGKLEERSPADSTAEQGAEVGLMAEASSSDHPGSGGPGPEDDHRATVRGRVVDPDGRPITGATVFFLKVAREDAEPGREVPIKVVQTGEDGVFTCHPRALPSKFRLLVRAEGFARWQAPFLSVDGRRHTDLGDVTLTTGTPLIFTVRDDDGAAVPDARVLVQDPEAEGSPDYARSSFEGQTNDLGTLALPGGDYGEYRVTITKPGHAPFEKTFAFPIDEAATEFSMQAVLPLATDFIEGSVIDTGGFPLAKVWVAVEPLRPVGGVTSRCGEETDARGRFQIGPLPEGDYRVEVETAGMQLQNSMYAKAGGRPVQLVASHGGSVTGRVRSGLSMPGPVELTVWEQDGRGNFRPLSNQIKSVVEAGNGRLRIDGLPPGTFMVRASAKGLAAARSEPFSLEAGQCHSGLDLELGKGGEIRGRVIGSRGQAVVGVRVSSFEGRQAPSDFLRPLDDSLGCSTTSSAADGKFALPHLSPGLHILVFEAEGLPSRTVGPVALGAGDELRLGNIGLGSGSSVSGTVVDAEGRPVQGAMVRLNRVDASVRLVLVTGESGNFSAQGLEHGEYRLQAGPPSGSEGAGEPIQLGVDENVRRTLTLRKP